MHTTNIHALSGIRTHDPSVRASEDSYGLDRSATVTGLLSYTVIYFYNWIQIENIVNLRLTEHKT
jgi:hypothetical protein